MLFSYFDFGHPNILIKISEYNPRLKLFLLTYFILYFLFEKNQTYFFLIYANSPQSLESFNRLIILLFFQKEDGVRKKFYNYLEDEDLSRGSIFLSIFRILCNQKKKITSIEKSCRLTELV